LRPRPSPRRLRPRLTRRTHSSAKGKLTIKTDPAGCDVWLNGELQSSVTPTVLEGLPLDARWSSK